MPIPPGGVLGALAVFSLAALVPATARGEGQLNNTFEAEVSLNTSVGSRAEGELGSDPGVGVGPTLRVSGSLYKLLTVDTSAPGPGVRFSDWWSAGFGLGYLGGADADEIAPLWGALHIEATLRVDYGVSDEVETFARGGYVVGADTAGRPLGAAFDALFVAVGFRVGRVLGEAGYGVGAIEGDLNYLLLDAEYAFRALGFRYVGVRLERITGEGTDLTSVSLTLGSR